MIRKSTQLKYVIGIDEVGRGPLAGPVTVCAFAILKKDIKILERVNAKDSKLLSAQKRNTVASLLKTLAEEDKCRFAITSIASHGVDKKGLTQAIASAIASSLKKLKIDPKQADIYLDGGLKAPQVYPYQQTIIRGDGTIPVISCASVLAKVHRDRLMERYDDTFPGYGFLNHKGYGTPEHYRAIRKLGMTEIHRRTFLRGY
jgi:ribonuclease HII